MTNMNATVSQVTPWPMMEVTKDRRAEPRVCAGASSRLSIRRDNMASQRGESAAPAKAGRKGLDKSHYLYIAVIAAVILGALVGLLFPEVGKSLKPLGDGFIKLIKMMIGPVIFCTLVLGIGSIAKAATVGKLGGLRLGYFIVMSTFALATVLGVGNIIHPGEGLALAPYDPNKKAATDSTVDFLLG